MTRKVDVDELRLRWLTALTSGVYQQAQSELVTFVEEERDNEDEEMFEPPVHPEYCCIGVLCDVAVELGTWLKIAPNKFRVGKSKPFTAEIPTKFLAHFGLSVYEQVEYIRMNDQKGLDFIAIAEVAGGSKTLESENT